ARASNYPFKGRLFFIFYFFKLSVDNVVIFRVVCRSVSGASLLAADECHARREPTFAIDISN
ncbi:hypothetical protein, partial [Salmonella enterica]|uniref:hypothetical protein n=1 Tax=Salmonella enterica TaxID=28901 RepID=UPI001C637FD6